jgi:hypothetical protein
MKIWIGIKKLKLRVIFNNRIYEMPDCRFKIQEGGGLMALVKNEDGKWIGIKGKIEILNELT